MQWMRARGYAKLFDDGHVFLSPEVDASAYMAGGGFVATPSDVARFGAALLEGKIVSPQTLDAMLTPQKLKNGRGNEQSYALGFRSGVLFHSATPNRREPGAHHAVLRLRHGRGERLQDPAIQTFQTLALSRSRSRSSKGLLASRRANKLVATKAALLKERQRKLTAPQGRSNWFTPRRQDAKGVRHSPSAVMAAASVCQTQPSRLSHHSPRSSR